MSISVGERITELARVFLQPKSATHRQYEALRAFFVERRPSAEVARAFGYTPGSFRVLCHEFRRNPERSFFAPPKRGPQAPPKRDRQRERVIGLRKQNLSIYDIASLLREEGMPLSPAAVSLLLREEGFARLPRRGDEERPGRPSVEAAPQADVRSLDLTPRRWQTKFGGVFLFLPFLARIPFDQILSDAGFPSSKMVPAASAMRSLLGLKLVGKARHSHVMSHVFDEGLALFAGLNVIPKRSFLTEYSCRIEPSAYPRVMSAWFDAVGALGLERGSSFDLDFHTIPFHGEDALVEKHYVSKRSRRQKGILAFLAQDGQTRVFCYANARLRKEDQADEILRFVEYWKTRTGNAPEELIFDSKVTTYANLHRLNRMGIDFITLRRRTDQLLDAIHRKPASAWRRIRIDGIGRAYRTPRILDARITLPGYDGPIRQLTVTDLGHEEPTLLLTNQLRRSAAKLIHRYAQRMIVENSIADGIDFFHMDALSSAVAMKVSCDLQLTLMASSLYRLLGQRIGNGYETAKTATIFRDLLDATAEITLTEDQAIIVRYQKRAHNPFLLAAGIHNERVRVPWLGNFELRLVLG